MEVHFSEACLPLLEQVLFRLQGVRKAHRGIGWTACCPAHNDRHPSLSVGVGKEGQVLLHCHAGCAVEAIVAPIGLTMADLFPNVASGRRRSAQKKLSLLDFALEKQLHWRFLINHGVVEEAGGGLRMTYYQMDGTPAARHRIRHAFVAKEGSRWTNGPGAIVPYGLEQLEDARQHGRLVLVEGETDRLTLLWHRYPALGIPGAEMVRATLNATYLEGFKELYVVQEPDAAGKRFVEEIACLLTDWRWNGSAHVVTLGDVKDPNELHQHDPKAFRAIFHEALQRAQPLPGLAVSLPTLHVSPEPALVLPASPDPPPDPGAPFTLRQLLASSHAPTSWTIEGLLPEGVFLLGGKPKQGKSWLALQMALATASGSMLLNTYQTTRGEVLYLALEDTLQRLQARTRLLLSSHNGAISVPDGLELAVQWPRLDQEGGSQLEAYIQTHPLLRLIIIDTWTQIAPRSTKGTRSQYEGDYASLTQLKQLAEMAHLTVLVIHHLRKAEAKDVLDEVTGSIGLVGAVDGILILKRERGEGDATLFVTGRDIQERTLAMRFDATTAWWVTADPPDEEESQLSTTKGDVYARTQQNDL